MSSELPPHHGVVSHCLVRAYLKIFPSAGADKHLRDRFMHAGYGLEKIAETIRKQILGLWNAILLYILIAPRDNGKVFSLSMIRISQ